MQRTCGTLSLGGHFSTNTEKTLFGAEPPGGLLKNLKKLLTRAFMSPVGSSLHHQPSQITCHITSLADLLLRDQIVVPITGQILADTLSLSHHLSHFHSVLSTQTTSPL